MDLTSRLTRICHTLVQPDVGRAHALLDPQRRAAGYWFGGGNMIQTADGRLYLVGRYRNPGDARTGIHVGERGLELAIFMSQDHGRSFQKMLSWDKKSLNSPTGDVLSIEGSCLRQTPDGVELYVSTEKAGVAPPTRVSEFLKPGAGIWSIDVLRAASVEELLSAAVCPAFRSNDPIHLHVKDPFVWTAAEGDQLGFCSHPFSWSSSNTGVADFPLPGSEVTSVRHGVLPRGTTWDVAITRATCVIKIPPVGVLRDESVHLVFYCGGECVRPLEEHSAAVRRPRGYSCEELGGAAWYRNDDRASAERLSDLLPMFMSPWGTGCCRYVDVLETPDRYFVTWQQSQPDLSQPLILNIIDRRRIEEILA